MVYASETDPLCYPGTNVLRNKLDIQDLDELAQFELSMFLIRADEPFPPGALDYSHYRALHHHLFQDVYAWAGKPRRIRIGKGGNWFCYPEYIDREGSGFSRTLPRNVIWQDWRPRHSRLRRRMCWARSTPSIRSGRATAAHNWHS